jgi:signal transduction histidine kinase
LLLAAKDSLFSQEKIKQMQNVAFNEQMRQQEIEADKEQYKSRIRLYILIVALIVFITIGAILWQNNLQKQKAFDLLEKQKAKTEQTLLELKSTQNQLIQKEKMASLGELTAGIAHEIQNPLNFVNNFSEVSLELVEEIEEELGKVNLLQQEKQYLLKLLVDLSQNQEKIHNHGKRADSIVKGMLQHSISHTGEKEPTDINALVEEYLRLSYHGLRAKNKDFNVDFKLEAGPAVGKVEVVPQEIGRVLLNLFNNAFYATAQKKLQLNGQYKPLVIVSTKTIGDKVEIRVRDNGTGIPQAVQQKIFQPFFTTKPTGEGTGLGLSLSYDIITKGYGGELKVDSKEGEYTELTISLISFKVADHVY